MVLKGLDDSCFPKRSIQSCSIYNFPDIPFSLNFQHFFNPTKLTDKPKNKNLSTIKSPLLISLKVQLAKITYEKNTELLQPLFNGRYIHRKSYEDI